MNEETIKEQYKQYLTTNPIKAFKIDSTYKIKNNIKNTIKTITPQQLKTLYNKQLKTNKELLKDQKQAQKEIDDIHKTTIDFMVEDKKSDPIEHYLNIKKHSISLKDVKLKHCLTPKVEALLKSNIPIYLYGPTGAGKSFLVENIANKYKLKFIFVNSPQDVVDLKGYLDIKSKYKPTNYRLMVENGGIFFLDELDSCPPEVLVCINSDLSGDHVVFPDKIVKKHKNFRFVSAGNTLGMGGDLNYIARNRLDSSTLNRFLFVNFQHDTKLELKLCPIRPDIIKKLQEIRKNIKKVSGEASIISTRNLIQLNTLLAMGFNLKPALKIVFGVLMQTNQNIKDLYNETM